MQAYALAAVRSYGAPHRKSATVLQQSCVLPMRWALHAAALHRTTPMWRVLPSTFRLILSFDCPGMSALICA